MTRAASDTVFLMFNNGSGGFPVVAAYGVGNAPIGAALGELDNDGDLDLVTANIFDASVSVLLNQCAIDCGSGVCDGDENCMNCPSDCGVCVCGNETCDPGEDCDNCEEDCGVCSPLCDVCYSDCGDIPAGAPCANSVPDDYITVVTFAGIDNTTGSEGCPCSYSNYSAIQGEVVAGETYDLTVSICSEGQWVQHARAWFDWNGNGEMECDESVYLGSGTDATLTTAVTAPAGTPPGCYAMRVIEQYLVDPGCTGACTGGDYGETEDYTVCVAIPLCGDDFCTGEEDCATCETDCGACPFCGDGVVNLPGEECDGGDDAACSGQCVPPGLPDECTCPSCGPCPTDVDDSGDTGASDLAVLLGSWGPCAPGEACECLDDNDDGVIDAADLAVLLGAWGLCP